MAQKAGRERQQELTPDQIRIKRQLLTRAHASTAGDISNAVVIKHGNIFSLTTPSGIIPIETHHGFGIFLLDCRFLRGYEFKVGGIPMIPLIAVNQNARKAVYQLTNDGPIPCGDKNLDKQELSFRITRRIQDPGGHPRESLGLLEDEFQFKNLSENRIILPVGFHFVTDFEDIFEVRGLIPARDRRDTRHRQEKDRLIFSHVGSDGMQRSVTIGFSKRPGEIHENGVQFHLPLNPREEALLQISIQLRQNESIQILKQRSRRKHQQEKNTQDQDTLEYRSEHLWLEQESRVNSDSLILNRALDRAFLDLHMLKSRIGEDDFFAAGLPWFGTLFGRDSILTAMQILAFDPSIARETLRLLAHFQGRRHDSWNDEEPGKILHELRRGELARSNQVPYRPYYGTVDATPLFLILLEQYCAWTGDLALFLELRENVEAALAWMDSFENGSGDSHIRYWSPYFVDGLVNQGWKDGGNSIITESGDIPHPPIALCEVQAYAWRAKNSIARLFLLTDEKERARALQNQALKIRARFERDFWLEDLGSYAMALHGPEQKPTRVAASNAGHALWAGIAQPERAKRVRDRLMQPDLFSGWGIRTLSEKEEKYNPVGYHLGTVWPHENSMIADGFRNYGFDRDAQRIFTGILEAATFFQDNRLPETFSGFSRDQYSSPVRYPVACSPQAWAAGSLPYFVTSMLGLVPDAFARLLRIVRPILPDFVDRLEIRKIQVGDGWVSLRFHRHQHSVATEIVERQGDLRVLVEPPEVS